MIFKRCILLLLFSQLFCLSTQAMDMQPLIANRTNYRGLRSQAPRGRKNEVFVLKFSLQQADFLLKWRKVTEFEFEGAMYDVHKSEIHADSIYYFVHFDKLDTLYLKKRQEISAFPTHRSTHQVNFFLPNQIDAYLYDYLSEQNSFDNRQENSYLSIILLLQSPPPEFLAA